MHVYASDGVKQFLATQTLPKGEFRLAEFRLITLGVGMPTTLKDGMLVLTIPNTDPKEDRTLQLPAEEGIGVYWAREYHGTKLTLVPSFLPHPSDAEREAEREFLTALKLIPLEIELPTLVVEVAGCHSQGFIREEPRPKPIECKVVCFWHELEAYIRGYKKHTLHSHVAPPGFVG